MNIVQERELLKKRLKNKKQRDSFVSAYTDETIPFQIRALREQHDRQWTQKELASRTGMKQERISAIENPNYCSYSLRTLKQLSSALDVALVVRFVSFGELAEWKLNLSSKSLEVPSFDKDPYFLKEREEEATISDTTRFKEIMPPSTSDEVVRLIDHKLKTISSTTNTIPARKLARGMFA